MNRTSEDLFSMENLYLAYRKAKFDVYYERSQPMAEAFSDYEGDLHTNLTELCTTLRNRKPNWFSDVQFMGRFGMIPKGLTVAQPKEDRGPHFSLSDLGDAWNHLIKTVKEKPKVEFRAVAHFTVNMYIVCALWVNLVGHKYDACLSSSAYGSRLRRLRKNTSSPDGCAKYHIDAPGSFRPYFYSYRDWREHGLKAIEHELSENRRVIAITMDLAGFYHNVDPTFLLDDTYLRRARFASINKRSLTENERRFTDQLIRAFETWSKQLPSWSQNAPPGVPVGPSAPRVIANVLLVEFDRLIQNRLTPIYYGRYVDDIFLVIRDTGRFSKPSSILKHIALRIPRLQFDAADDTLTLDLPYGGKSKLIFKGEKQRLFLLRGEVGQDLLETIRNKIDEVSSEWRLLPNLDDLDKSPASRVLTAAKQSNQDADSLRKADELSLRRLGFSLLLRSADALARDLPPDEWKTERVKFYRFVERHVLTPLRFMDLNDYLPRLLGLSIACRDWPQARRTVLRISEVLRSLQRHAVVSPPTPPTKAARQWRAYRKHLVLSLREAVHCSYPLDGTTHASQMAAKRVIREIDALHADDYVPTDSTPLQTARHLFGSDLAREPFKESLIEGNETHFHARPADTSNLPESLQQRASVIKDFLDQGSSEQPVSFAHLFPTRPLNAAEITECVPDTAKQLELLAKFVRALRGTWVLEYQGEDDADSDSIEIGRFFESSENRSYEFSD